MEKINSRKKRNRIKIMHAAKVLFEKNGIENVTFAQIAEEADLCRTTVFNHFAGTKELLLAIFAEEIRDINEYIAGTGKTGRELIISLYDRLIEDTANYPSLSVKLLINAVTTGDDNTVRMIEEITRANLENSDEKQKELEVILITGTFYGLINHYHVNNKTFDSSKMKMEFHLMMDRIIGGEKKNDKFRNQQMG